MGSVSVLSCRCCMFVSCVHPVAVLNAAFFMICSLLMLVEDAIGDHTEEAYSKHSPKPEMIVHDPVSFFSCQSIIHSDDYYLTNIEIVETIIIEN